MKLSKLTLLSSLPLLFSCEPINRYLKIEDDAPIEQLGEALIESATKIKVDLTPTSPE